MNLMTNGNPLLVAALAIIAGVGAAQADDPAPPKAPAPVRHVYLIGTLRITQPYLDLPPGPDGPVLGHLTIENRGDAPDRLIGATADGGGSVALVTASEGPTDVVTVPANATLVLAPGADHLALSGLGGITAASAPVAAILHFERAGFLHVGFETDRAKVWVEKPEPATADKPVDLAK